MSGEHAAGSFRPIRRVRRGLRSLFDVAWTIRASVAMSLVACAALYLPDQLRESYRILADAEPTTRLLRFAGFLAALVFLAVQLWSAGRTAIFLVPTRGPGSPLPEGPWRLWLERHLPRFVAVLPCLAAAGGLQQAADGAAGRVATFTVLLAIACAVLAVALYFAFMARRKFMFGGEPRPERVRAPWSLHRQSRLLMGVLALFAVAMLALASAAPLTYAAWITTPALIMVWAGAVAWLLATLAWLASATRLPIIGALLLVALGLSAANLSDNHRLRLASDLDGVVVAPDPVPPAAADGGRWPELVRDVDAWWRANGEPGVPPRIVLVAAEGGGIRAAYTTALTLAPLHERCPSLSRHLLAVSGVSGGSVGAAVYTAALGARPPPDAASCLDGLAELTPEIAGGGAAELADRALRADLVEAVIIGLLHGDALARWWPREAFDRARTLEDALVHAWTGAGADPARLTSGISRHWSPAAGVPALLLNTTTVETGARLVIANIGRREPALVPAGRACPTARPCLFADLVPAAEPPLVSAAFASARFPLVTPVATVPITSHDCSPDAPLASPPRPCRLVDGGYFENSGTETIMDALLALDDWLAATGGAAMVVRITNSAATTKLAPGTGGRPWAPGGFNELLSPVRALLSTRSARGRLAEDRLTTMAASRGERLEVVRLRLAPGGVEIPLGWSLSDAARTDIRRQILGGEPRRCLVETPAADVTTENRNALVRLAAFVDGTAPPRCADSAASDAEPVAQREPAHGEHQ